ncbi:hypothetical protein [Xanthomonas hortorum]|uniref:hypothetical protein n=1 Tax=Xanthomonas hortorum TaxID=56454 RepID=UPI001F209632|nr:hypothetical protein [Xanthomonas hortorum]MCE4358294.1 hypothetical protein [Xanthomonas hortorum pv. taraxaci]
MNASVFRLPGLARSTLTMVPHSDVPQGWMSTSACWLSVNHFPVIGSAANAGVLDTARAKAR